MKIGSLLSIVLFTLVALAHLLRLLTSAPVVINGWTLPQWPSVLAVIGPGLIAWLLWKESRPR